MNNNVKKKMKVVGFEHGLHRWFAVTLTTTLINLENRELIKSFIFRLLLSLNLFS